MLSGRAEILSVDSMQSTAAWTLGQRSRRPRERSLVAIRPHRSRRPRRRLHSRSVSGRRGGPDGPIESQGGVALLRRGTGLYFRALTTRLDITAHSAGSRFSRRMAMRRLVSTAQPRFAISLLEIDAAAAEKIHPNDVRRMIRSIEVFERRLYAPLSDWHRIQSRVEPQNSPERGSYLCPGLADRDELIVTIQRRVDMMVFNRIAR